MIRLVELSDQPAVAPDAIALLTEYLWLPDSWHGNPPLELPPAWSEEVAQFPGNAAPPTGAAVLAFDGSVAVGIGLLRPFSDQVAEMKRLYVRPAARRLGVSRAIYERLIERARSLGYRQFVLDVMSERLAAVQLYDTLGFVRIDPFRTYPALNLELIAFGMDL